MRKLSAFEYTHVQLLANIIKSLLDGFIAGGTIQQVIKNVKADASKPASKVTSNQNSLSVIFVIGKQDLARL